MASIVWDEKPIPGGVTSPIPEIEVSGGEASVKADEFVAPQSGMISYTDFQKMDATAKVAFIARGGLIGGL